MKLRLQSCCSALALAGLCALPFATAAQTLGGGAAKLTSEEVLELETALAKLNFDPGKIDGVIDGQTRAAIRLYQDFAALTPDAKATPALLAEVLSVARSFAEMRSAPTTDPAPDVSSNATPEKSVETSAPPKEPDAPKLAETPTQVEEPKDIPAPVEASPPAEAEVAEAEVEPLEKTAAPSETPDKAPTAPEPAPQTAEAPIEAPSAETPPVEPPSAEAAGPAKDAGAPKEPEAETSIAKKSPPESQPAPKEEKPPAAAGYNIGSVISRLAETGKLANKSAKPKLEAQAKAAPLSGQAEKEQIARVPAKAPAAPPIRKPGKAVNGYAAFLEGYKAAQEGDFEYAAQLYTDAINSKKLTLEHLGDAHFNRANAFHFLGRYDQSIKDYGVTVGAKPRFAGAYYNRGFAYQAKGDEKQAVDDFRRARDLGLQRLGVRAPDRMPPLR